MRPFDNLFQSSLITLRVFTVYVSFRKVHLHLLSQYIVCLKTSSGNSCTLAVTKIYGPLNRPYLKEELNLHINHVFEKTFLDAAMYRRVTCKISNIRFGYNSVCRSL